MYKLNCLSEGINMFQPLSDDVMSPGAQQAVAAKLAELQEETSVVAAALHRLRGIFQVLSRTLFLASAWITKVGFVQKMGIGELQVVEVVGELFFGGGFR